MVGWIILGTVVFLITALLFTRLHFHIVYKPPDILVSRRVGPFVKQLMPPKETRTKPSARRKKKLKQDEKKRGFSEYAEMLPQLIQLARAIRVDKLEADIVVGGEDPADTAIAFGYYNAAWHSLRPWLYHFSVQSERVNIGLDMDAEKTEASGQLKVSFRVVTLLRLVMKSSKARIIERNENAVGHQKVVQK